MILDVQLLRLLEPLPPDQVDERLECDVLIVGGGMGGCAAALAACRGGRSVVLTEETDWLGGQMTAQGVSALDEHPWIETAGRTAGYAELRRRIREYYLRPGMITPPDSCEWGGNPGQGWVSRLCFEPVAGLAALRGLLGPHLASGRLVVLLRHRAVSAEVRDDTVRAVVLRDLDGEVQREVRASFALDATELGDLLPLTGAEYATGAEAAGESGEPHAPPVARPDHNQSFTYPFVLELRAGERHSIAQPPDYVRNRERQPYTLSHRYHDDRGSVTYGMFSHNPGTPGSFWAYRRLVAGVAFTNPAHANDLAMINWPGNDFRHGNLVDVTPGEALASLRAAADLALGFCYWIQNECPRDEGGVGYPELLLRPDVLGTRSGLSRFPYIRESRRIVARRTIREQEIAAHASPGPRAPRIADSVGIGHYAIDIHPCEGEDRLPPADAHPFQIPLGALIPIRLRNLLPACKNLGTTHITNGAFRLHPIEWAIGEAAGCLAVFCLDRKLTPAAVADDPRRVRRLQRRLVRAGVPLYWYADLNEADPVFEAAHALAAWGVPLGDHGSLEFDATGFPDAVDLHAVTSPPPWARQVLIERLPALLPDWRHVERHRLAEGLYRQLRGL